VIVAAGTCVRETEESCPDRIGDIVQDFLAAFQQLPCVALVGEVAVEAGRNQGRRIVGIKLVSRDLLSNEAVIWLVLIERIDDVIAITPDIGSRFIALEAFAIGLAGQVEPVARPSFAVTRGGQQPVHHFRESVG
jgi:hypothetical protein